MSEPGDAVIFGSAGCTGLAHCAASPLLPGSPARCRLWTRLLQHRHHRRRWPPLPPSPPAPPPPKWSHRYRPHSRLPAPDTTTPSAALITVVVGRVVRRWCGKGAGRWFNVGQQAPKAPAHDAQQPCTWAAPCGGGTSKPPHSRRILAIAPTRSCATSGLTSQRAPSTWRRRAEPFKSK